MRCRTKLPCSIRALALLSMFVAGGAHAGEICVDSAPLLQTAFVIAAGQAQPYTIKLVQGTYALSGTTNANFSAPTTILGGYTAGCANRAVNPDNTVIDIGGSGSNLYLNQAVFSPRAGVSIDGVTIANGTRLLMSAGQYNLFSANGPGDITLTRSHIRDIGVGFALEGSIWPIEFQSTTGKARLENVLIDSVSASGQDGCSVAFSLEGDSQASLNYVTADLANAHDLCILEGIGGGVSYQVDIYNSIVWASDGTLSAVHGVDPVGQANPFVVKIGYSVLHAYYGVGSVDNALNAYTNPLWINPATGNYRLQAASPAVNSGYLLDPLGTPPTDIGGATRWVGSHPDRGAYESTFNDLSTFTVTSTADAGAGTLRQAILDANSSSNPGTIKFNIAAACPAQLKLATALPHVTSPIIIDGYTQPGAVANTDPDASNATLCVVIKPISGTLGNAIQVPAGAPAEASLVLRGLGFGGFGQAVVLLGGSNHLIAGNQFGGSVGGVALAGAGLQAITIGINAGGKLVVGGQSVADRNIIGGGGFYGINVQSAVDSTPDQCRIVNNLIGVAANGITPVPNFTGIGLGGNGCAVISNRIVGNSQDAILINGGSGNLIQSNVLGLDVNGSGIANSGAGVHITSGNSNVIGTSAASNITGLLFSNTIRFMGDAGVLASAGSGNSIRSNLMQDNGWNGASGMDIDIGAAGPTANDADDVDGGANLLQNFPLVNGVAFASPPPPAATNVSASVKGLLNAQSGSYRVDAYFGNGCSANGRGHAQAYAGAKQVTIAAGSTRAGFTLSATVPNVQGNAVLALVATDAAGNSSEIGTCVALDTIFRDGHE